MLLITIDKNEINRKENVCVICLDGKKIENKNIFGCSCNVYYHKECINGWTKNGKLICPICRSIGNTPSRSPTCVNKEELESILLLLCIFLIFMFVGSGMYIIRNI